MNQRATCQESVQRVTKKAFQKNRVTYKLDPKIKPQSWGGGGVTLATIILSLILVFGSASMDMCLGLLGRCINKMKVGEDGFIKIPAWRETQLL